MSVRLQLLILGAALGGAACSETTAPVDPCALPAATDHPLGEVGGSGCGSVRVAPYANNGSFATEITVTIARGQPNTTYTLQRAPEVGRLSGSDGVCQRALGIAPWSSTDPAAPSFITFPLPNAGPSITLTTDASGRGQVAFDFKSAGIATPAVFDVMFRLLDNPVGPTRVFLSTCFTVSAP